MFNITRTQPIANALVKLLRRFTATPELRRKHKAVSDTIQQFERAGWQPVAFDMALDEIGGFVFSYDGKLIIDHEPKDQTPAAIQSLLEHYLKLIDFKDPAVDTTIPDMFSLEEAAAYLGITVDGMKYHLYRGKNIEPSFKFGKKIGFTREDLDAFKLTMKPAGRPKLN